MRALLLVAVTMLAAPWTALAAPVNADVAWLADTAGLDVSDLPSTVTVTEQTLLNGLVTERLVEVALADVASEIRGAWAPSVDVERQFAGAGVRSADAGTRGIRWTGFVVGSASNTPCMAITVQHSQPDPGLGRGALMVGVHGETPGGRGSGVATMDVQLAPNAGPGTPVATTLADGLVTVGGTSRLCLTIFGIRITSAAFFGDGIIYADGP